MVECVCGVVAQAADRVWKVERITERKGVQLRKEAEVHQVLEGKIEERGRREKQRSMIKKMCPD